MRVRIVEDLCTGCGLCWSLCKCFEGDGVAKVSEMCKPEVPKDLEACVRRAARACPTGAIKIY